MGLACGVLLVGLAFVVLPELGSSAQLVSDSGFPLLMFFGGSYLICGVFALRGLPHGRFGLFGIGALGVFAGGISLFRGGPLLSGAAVLTTGLVICGVLLLEWRGSWRKRGSEGGTLEDPGSQEGR